MNKGLTKMCADKSGKNTPNAPKFICPSPKVLDFDEIRPHWVSVVRDIIKRSWCVNFSIISRKCNLSVSKGTGKSRWSARLGLAIASNLTTIAH